MIDVEKEFSRSIFSCTITHRSRNGGEGELENRKGRKGGGKESGLEDRGARSRIELGC